MDIVFVPGLNCNAQLFAPQVSALEKLARCHVADHSVADSMEAIAASVLASAPPKFVLTGLSMGGYVAYEILRQQPDRVTALCLLDTRASPDTPEDTERRRQTIDLARNGHFANIHPVLWPRLVHPARVTDSVLEGIVVGMMQETGAERFIRQQTAIIDRIDYWPSLGDIAVPTTVVVGAQDAITPPAMARSLHKAIRGSRYVEIPECGHLSSLERPDIVTQIIRDVLREVSSTAG
jgi:pimeloyl-ACP methyl ester carboxylesterase